MKKFLTLLILAIMASSIANATKTTTTLDSIAFQAIVDYSNAEGLNQSEFFENTDSYFGASAYYNNFDFRDEKWNVGGTFASWEEAAQTAITVAALPTILPEATTEDTIAVYFKYFNGTATLTDYFVFNCTSTEPLTFAVLETPNGSYKADILAFALSEQVTDTGIDYENQTITTTVAPGTDASALTPEVEISENATSEPAIGSTVDFSSPVVYTVTAEDGTTKEWTVTISIMEESLTSIYDIQFVEDPATSDASPLFEQTVIVKGIVTGFGTFGSYNKYYVQDGDGEWSGIYVYDRTTGVVLEAGDEVKLTGTIDEYYFVTEIAASKVEILSSRNALPEPVELTGEITEGLEGVLVKASNVTISEDTDDTDSKKYLIADNGTTQFKIFGELFENIEYEEGKTYNLTGLVAYTYDNYRICPRGINDIEAQSAVYELKTNAFNLYPNPANSTLSISGIDTDYVKIKNINGQVVATKNVINKQINISELTSGVYFIEANNKIARFVKH